MLTPSPSFGYCIHVYLKSLWSDKQKEPTHSSDNNLPSYTASIRTQTARAIYRRLRSVLYLQWRGILIVTICLVDVIFFAVVFVYLDDLENALLHDFVRAEPWVLCLVESSGDRNKCIDLGQKFLVPESTVAAVLVMISLISIELFLLTFRWSLLTGWQDFFAHKLHRKREFVSLDALSPRLYDSSTSTTTTATRKYGANGAVFEMQRQQPHHDNDHSNYGYTADIKSLSPTVTSIASPGLYSYPSPPPPAFSSMSSDRRSAPSHFADPLPPRPQHRSSGSAGASSPRRSASSSRRNSRPKSRALSTHSRLASMVDPARTMGWDPTSTYALGGVRDGEKEGSGRAM